MHPETRISVIYDPRLGNEATSTAKGIRLGEKFFQLPTTKDRNHVLAHEVGHDLEWKSGDPHEYVDLLSKGAYVYEGRSANPSEVFAETFAVYADDREDLKRRYPEIYKVHTRLESRHPEHYKLAKEIANGGIIVNPS